jgi:hypothetical protein
MTGEEMRAPRLAGFVAGVERPGNGECSTDGTKAPPVTAMPARLKKLVPYEPVD